MTQDRILREPTKPPRWPPSAGVLALVLAITLGLAILFPDLLKPGWRGLLRRAQYLTAPNPMARSAGGPYATTDTYLAGLQIPSPSQSVLAGLAHLAPDEAILFISPGNDPFDQLTYRVIAYLSWPRQVGALDCRGPGQSPVMVFQAQAGRRIALLYYRMSPPARIAKDSKAIGPNLTLVAVSEKAEWTSYCAP